MSRRQWLLLAWLEVVFAAVNIGCAFLGTFDAWSWMDLGFGLIFAGVAWAYFRQAAEASRG